MKTSWTVRYIESEVGVSSVNKWCRAKQDELEEQTEVKWTFCHVSGKMQFAPTWGRDTIAVMDFSNLLASKLSFDGMMAKPFLVLSEETGYALAKVVSIAKFLVQTAQAVAVVNRMGHPVAIYKRR